MIKEVHLLARRHGTEAWGIQQTFSKGDAAARRKDAELAMRRWQAHWADAYAFEFKIVTADIPKWRYSSRLPAFPEKSTMVAPRRPARPELDLKASADIPSSSPEEPTP